MVAVSPFIAASATFASGGAALTSADTQTASAATGRIIVSTFRITRSS
jgi:hypothetical protein